MGVSMKIIGMKISRGWYCTYFSEEVHQKGSLEIQYAYEQAFKYTVST